jgi:hypothetical protein
VGERQREEIEMVEEVLNKSSQEGKMINVAQCREMGTEGK